MKSSGYLLILLFSLHVYSFTVVRSPISLIKPQHNGLHLPEHKKTDACVLALESKQTRQITTWFETIQVQEKFPQNEVASFALLWNRFLSTLSTLEKHRPLFTNLSQLTPSIFFLNFHLFRAVDAYPRLLHDYTMAIQSLPPCKNKVELKSSLACDKHMVLFQNLMNQPLKCPLVNQFLLHLQSLLKRFIPFPISTFDMLYSDIRSEISHLFDQARSWVETQKEVTQQLHQVQPLNDLQTFYTQLDGMVLMRQHTLTGVLLLSEALVHQYLLPLDANQFFQHSLKEVSAMIYSNQLLGLKILYPAQWVFYSISHSNGTLCLKNCRTWRCTKATQALCGK
ncbi:hypothetical protein HMI54_007909 [Coelomomyces lativittatus]|nr:hypothetical protein HMI54_007909 [Coelomomyces lativittatus]KAJ1503802.1 hypothetical protein HMI56_001944 [Coelomomyces lativittatus]KAJ1506933.1 hypothetical protein HMI55_000972 [Coelomomyces lativittatus]